MRDGLAVFLATLVSWCWTILLAGSAVWIGIQVARELDVVAVSNWAALPPFLSIPLQRQGENAIIATLAGVVAGFMVLFVGGYVVQALLDGMRLRLVAGSLRQRIRRLDRPRATQPEQWRWFYDLRLTRLWREFVSSVQVETRIDPVSGVAHSGLIAAIPAEMVFSQQALVDVPMRVEFFRHLPGILTGSGIVSTFAGILMGLTQFDPSVGPDQVTRELQGLFMGVSTAFSASFFAIVTAMLVTVVEKLLLHWRYAQVLAFQGELNRHFGLGGGGADPEVRLASTKALWEEPVQRIVDSVARLEPLLRQEQSGREESTLAISLSLSGVMATIERAFDTWSQRDARQRDEMRGVVADLNGWGQGVESLLARQLAGMVAELEQARLSRERLEARLAALEEVLERESIRAGERATAWQEMFGGMSGRLAGLLERQLARMEGEGIGQREELGTITARLAELGAGLDGHVLRLLTLMEEESRQRREESRVRGEVLANGLDGLGARLERQLALLQEDSVLRREGVAVVSQGLEGVGVRLERQLAVLKEESTARQEGVAVVVNGLERVGAGLDQQLALLREEATARREGLAVVVHGLERLGEGLHQQLSRLEEETGSQRTGFGAVVSGLDGLGDRLDRQFNLLQEETGSRREGITVVAHGLDALGARLDQQLSLLKEETGSRTEGLARMAHGLEGVGEKLDRQLSVLQEEIVAQREGIAVVANGLDALGVRLDQQLSLLKEETGSRTDGLARMAHGLEGVGEKLDRQLSVLQEERVAQREGIAVVAHGLEGVGEKLDRQLSVLQEENVARREGVDAVAHGLEGLGNRLDHQITLLARDAATRRELLTGVSARLSELASGMERHLGQQAAELAAGASRQSEWSQRAEEGVLALRGLAGKVDLQAEESRVFREQALEAASRLRQGLGELTTRLPSGAELAGWIRAAGAEVSAASEGRHARLNERLRVGHGELLAKVDAGVVAIEAVRADGADLMRLQEGLMRRLEAMQGGWQEGMAGLAERISQASGTMDATLREVLLKVERAASSGEEGMAMLFGEMGREMERMRRQIRESAGHVALQTREWLLSSGVGGEEKLQTLMKGVSEEFKTALSTLADERSQLDGDRESALMERLLSQTAEQAEGVKMAVLGELDETAKQLATHLRLSGEELVRSREESANEVVNVIAERMETAFGGVAQELAEMRKRLVAEQKAMESSLQAWVNEASRSTMEENRMLAQRLMEVQSHFDERHQGVIGVIDQLGRGLEQDLEQLRDGLYHKNEESSRHVEEHLTELGQLLEGVVTSLGREQSVFIEMLGERLDSLRRRLRVK
ncbi:MAG: hypothetical protein HQL91_03705 [Magnetococcales bacterium]|nr:hypothetical protein [Magnetococcales bacterium]